METEEDFLNFIEKIFSSRLEELFGIQPSQTVTKDLAFIFQTTLIRIRRLNEKKPDSKSVAKESEKLKNELMNTLYKEGGSFDSIPNLFAKKIDNLFGSKIKYPLRAFFNTRKIYSENCTQYAIKKEFTFDLFEFHKKYTGKMPKIKQDRGKTSDGGAFHDFYKLFESTLSDLCKNNQKKYKYYGKRADNTTYTYLKKNLKCYKEIT